MQGLLAPSCGACSSDGATTDMCSLGALRDTLTQHDQIARVDGATALFMRMTGKGSLASVSTAAATATEVTSDAARLSVLIADAFGKVFTGHVRRRR